jgi:hypothetical protein
MRVVSAEWATVGEPSQSRKGSNSRPTKAPSPATPPHLTSTHSGGGLNGYSPYLVGQAAPGAAGEPALLLRLTTELVTMRDNMADMLDMFTVRWLGGCTPRSASRGEDWDTKRIATRPTLTGEWGGGAAWRVSGQSDSVAADRGGTRQGGAGEGRRQTRGKRSVD